MQLTCGRSCAPCAVSDSGGVSRLTLRVSPPVLGWLEVDFAKREVHFPLTRAHYSKGFLVDLSRPVRWRLYL